MIYLDALADQIFTFAHGGGEASSEDRQLYRLYAVLARAKGLETTAEDVHDCWSAWMAEEMPDHRSLRPFEQLSERVQQMDETYVYAIRRACGASHNEAAEGLGVRHKAATAPER